MVATGDLYFALSDMDAQLAAVLLMGRENLGAGRTKALAVYGQRRSEAHRALLQGSNLARNDPAEQQTARSILDALGRYEQLAGQALQLDQRQSHAAGPPSPEVGALYRQAADIMKLDVLPKAYNLTLDNGTTVRRTYEAKHSAMHRRPRVGAPRRRARRHRPARVAGVPGAALPAAGQPGARAGDPGDSGRRRGHRRAC